MKKLLFLSTLMLLSMATLFSQTVLTYNTHAIKQGDKHHFIITDNASQGSDGANQIWDFSKLKYQSDLISQMKPVGADNAEKNIAEANTVIQEFDSKFYFKVTADRVEQYGVVSCGNSVTRYDVPFLKMEFPIAFGTYKEGNFSGSTINPNGNNSPLNGYYILEGDASGTLILPGDVRINNVLRLKTTQSTVYGCGESKTITYRWYTQNVRYPLLTIITSVSGDKETTIRTAYYKEAAEAIKKASQGDNQAQQTLKSLAGVLALDVSPNPIEDDATISYYIPAKTEVELLIINESGLPLLSQKLGVQEAGNYSLPISFNGKNFKPGVCVVKVIAGKESVEKKVIKIK